MQKIERWKWKIENAKLERKEYGFKIKKMSIGYYWKYWCI